MWIPCYTRSKWSNTRVRFYRTPQWMREVAQWCTSSYLQLSWRPTREWAEGRERKDCLTGLTLVRKIVRKASRDTNLSLTCHRPIASRDSEPYDAIVETRVSRFLEVLNFCYSKIQFNNRFAYIIRVDLLKKIMNTFMITDLRRLISDLTIIVSCVWVCEYVYWAFADRVSFTSVNDMFTFLVTFQSMSNGGQALPEDKKGRREKSDSRMDGRLRAMKIG